MNKAFTRWLLLAAALTIAMQSGCAFVISEMTKEKRIAAQQKELESSMPGDVLECLRGFGDKLEIQYDPAVRVAFCTPSEKEHRAGLAGLVRSRRLLNRNNTCSLVFCPYISVGQSGEHWLRLKIQYGGADWVFMDRVIVMIDGDKSVIGLDYYKDVDRTALGGSVRELADVLGDEATIRRIAGGKEVYVTVSGQHRRESYKLADKHIDDFRIIVECLDALESLQAGRASQ